MVVLIILTVNLSAPSLLTLKRGRVEVVTSLSNCHRSLEMVIHPVALFHLPFSHRTDVECVGKNAKVDQKNVKLSSFVQTGQTEPNSCYN